MLATVLPWLGLAILAVGVVATLYVLRGAQLRIARHPSQVKRVVERKVAERTAKLEEDIEQYRSLIENLHGVALEFDARDGTLVYIAPQAARMLECGVHDLTLDRLLATIHRDDRAAALEVMSRGFHDRPLDLRQITMKGRLIHTRTFLSEPDARRRVRGLILDVTREKHMETELRQAQKLESVGRLAAGIAHEINSPIQYIADSIDFVKDALGELPIADDYLRENIPAALSRAGDGVARVAAIIRSMRAFAHDKQEMTAVDVNQTITNTLTLTMNEHRYVADVVTDLGALPPVWCHPGDLQHVLVTIVVNAAQAIAMGEDASRRGRITVTTRSEREQIRITIADTGSGIPEHLRPQIFEPFFTTRGVGKGIGQNLAVAHSLIVERYRGSLVFESEVGHGTAFTVRLPAHGQESRAAA